ncbi:acetyl-CoA synthetase-like protein [Xylaria intraflava]|nr:acetyl-CoA synthetase-like protein [Xylaria intraflava]
MAASNATKDNRLMPVIIDELARDDPNRPWASIPRNDNDLSQGYEDISYEVLANAINKLAWIIDSSIEKSTAFETIAYFGASDLRYPMMQMAACKTGRVVFFSSSLNSLPVHVSLMKRLDCKGLFHSTGVQVDDILAGHPMARVRVPDLDDLLDLNDRAENYPYTKTYEEAAFDPYVCIHTSGTTGTPKPVLFNHAIMHTTFDQVLLPDVDGRPHVTGHFNPGLGTRVLLPVSPHHLSSAMLGTLLSFLGGGVLVLPYRNRDLTLNDPILDIITYSKVTVAGLVPYIMEAVARKPNPGDHIKQFKSVFYGGGELSVLARETWAKYTSIQNLWGATELGFPPELQSDPEDHAYVYFDMEHSGIEFREVESDDHADNETVKVYESVLTWTPKSAPYSGHFTRESSQNKSGPPYPDQHIGDLWTPHPDPKKARYAWRFFGRKDDVITLSSGTNVHTGNIERALRTHSLVANALVIGSKRLQPLALVELVPEADPDAISEIWESVLVPLNMSSQSQSRVARTHVLVVPTAGLVRTVKGSISKAKSESKFAKEIEAVYQKFGDAYQSHGRE